MFRVYISLIFAFVIAFIFQFGIILATDLELDSDYSNQSMDIGEIDRVSENYIHLNQELIDVIHYDLNLELKIEEQELYGDIFITGMISDSRLDTIVLNFYDNMTISSCNLNNKNQQYLHTEDKLFIPFNGTIGDTFKVNIKYHGTPHKKGLSSFVFGKINRIPLVYSLNEPNYASTWFPCNDKPDDKVLLDIKIKTDSKYVSVSNGKLVNTFTEKGKKTYHWRTIYPISTYLISINSSEYEHFYDYYISSNNDTMRIEYFSLPHHLTKAKTDWADHPKTIEVLSKLFGEYPFIKEKYGVTEFLWQMGAMEHQTITSIGSSLVTGHKHFSDIYVHELAHHWWGNCVGPKTWKDIWLNEGFATYSEALYDEYLYGHEALISNVSSLFDDEFEGTLYDPDELFGNTVYNKGAWVLHMLRFEIGDSIFFKVLKDYFNEYKYKNASTNDLIKIIKNNFPNDIEHFFRQWVFEGVGFINVVFEWNQKQGRTQMIAKNGDDTHLKTETTEFECSINLNQIQKGYKLYRFPLELKVVFDDSSEKMIKLYIKNKSEVVNLNFNKKVKNIIPDPNSWLLAKFHLNDTSIDRNVRPTKGAKVE